MVTSAILVERHGCQPCVSGFDPRRDRCFFGGVRVRISLSPLIATAPSANGQAHWFSPSQHGFDSRRSHRGRRATLPPVRRGGHARLPYFVTSSCPISLRGADRSAGQYSSGLHRLKSTGSRVRVPPWSPWDQVAQPVEHVKKPAAPLLPAFRSASRRRTLRAVQRRISSSDRDVAGSSPAAVTRSSVG
jgi:hypothetical protein